VYKRDTQRQRGAERRYKNMEELFSVEDYFGSRKEFLTLASNGREDSEKREKELNHLKDVRAWRETHPIPEVKPSTNLNNLKEVIESTRKELSKVVQKDYLFDVVVDVTDRTSKEYINLKEMLDSSLYLMDLYVKDTSNFGRVMDALCMTMTKNTNQNCSTFVRAIKILKERYGLRMSKEAILEYFDNELTKIQDANDRTDAKAKLNRTMNQYIKEGGLKKSLEIAFGKTAKMTYGKPRTLKEEGDWSFRGVRAKISMCHENRVHHIIDLS
jgi:hypothetical protein